MALVIAIGLGIVLFKGSNKSIITTNEEGDNVFTFSASEYIERYNSANEEELLDFSDFSKEVDSIGGNLYLYYQNSDGCYMIMVGKENYEDSVDGVLVAMPSNKYLNIATAAKTLRALYPNLSYDEALVIIHDIKNSDSQELEYKDILIWYELMDDGTALWSFCPIMNY